jgi:hypothetical protein
MLSSEATVAGEDVSMPGAKVDVPINDGSALKLWNSDPRALIPVTVVRTV